MAIIWVDPYIGSNGGPANGTTDQTTRNGSYAAPLKFSDVFSTSSSTAPTYNGLAVATGDEIRFKCLTTAQWKITGITDSWLKTSHNSSRFETATKSGTVPAAYLGSSPTKRPILYVDSCPGFGGEPALFPVQSVTDGGTYYYTDSNSTWWMNYAFGVMGGNGFTTSLINWDYALPAQPSAYCCLLQNLPAGVTVTAGWDSATTRNGKTFLILTYSGLYFYMGGNSNSATAATTWDVPELFVIHHSGSSGTLYPYIYAATSAVMNIGGIAWLYGINQLNILLQPSANLTIDTTLSPGYGPNVQAWSASPSSAILTIKKSASSYSTPINLNVSPTPAMTLRLKHVYHARSASNLVQGVSASYVAIELLAGGSLTAGESATAILNAPASSFTVGAGVTNTFSGAQYAAGTPLPTCLYLVTPPAGDGILSSGVSPVGAFYQVVGISFAAPELDNIYRGKTPTFAGDYRTADVTIVNSTTVTGETYRGLHFATNPYDQRPLALIFSNSGKGALLYNEASKANALTFQSATAAAGEYFYKQIAMDLPAYAGMSGVRVDVEYETSVNFNGEMHFTPYGINGTTGDSVAEPGFGGAGTKSITAAQVTPTTYSYTIPYSWLNGNAITQLLMKLKFRSGSNTGKFYIRNITTTQVP